MAKLKNPEEFCIRCGHQYSFNEEACESCGFDPVGDDRDDEEYQQALRAYALQEGQRI